MGFSLNRGPRQGPYGEQELRFLEALIPHMMRSVRLGVRMDAYKALQRAEWRTLESLAVGVILLDRKAQILFANTAARSLDGEHGPLRLRQSKVAHVSPSLSRRLDEVVQSALQGTPMAAIAVPRADGEGALTILASSVRART